MEVEEYRVGRFTLIPFRQLLANGAPVAIGGKALELLSVLAQARGALVTKSELMAAVWPKATVEDNAIQVHIAALRKVLGDDAGLLTTVRGLGYRLDMAPGPSETQQDIDASRSLAGPDLARRRMTLPVLAGVSLAIVAGAVWTARGDAPWAPRPAGARIAVAPFRTPASAGAPRGFAEGLADAIVGELADNQIQAVRGPGADLAFDGAVRSDGKTIDVDVRLDDLRERVTIWSDTVHGAASAPGALRASVAAEAADVAHWVKVGRGGKVKLGAASLAAFIGGRDSTTLVRHESSAAALADYRKVVADAPDFSWGHSAVASADAFSAVGQPPSPARDALRGDAQREARRALALDPHNGEAYLALELSTPPLDWQARETLLIQGASVDPGYEPVAVMEGRLLSAVGRGHDAVDWLRRAHDLDHLHNGSNWSLALALAAEGDRADSDAMLSMMERQWPTHPATKLARFWISVAQGQAEHVLALLADPETRPAGMDQTAIDAWRAAMHAVPGQDVRAKARAARLIRTAVAIGSLGHGESLTLLAMLGDLDGAFAVAQSYEPADPFAPPFLFLPQTRAMRLDPRFMPLARRLGFVAYWRATGRWADFCAEPGLAYSCRETA
jgi:DNA-binding winged helix-turn-helix (wHTH) protein/TolB-like protein